MRLTKSPLEVYFSMLRGTDTNIAISGTSFRHKSTAARCIRGVKNKIIPTCGSSHDHEDIPQDEFVVLPTPAITNEILTSLFLETAVDDAGITVKKHMLSEKRFNLFFGYSH